jgi:hypothetical protein
MAREPSGDALKDGYTIEGRRPRGALPGEIMDNNDASDFEKRADLYATLGRSAMQSMRLRDAYDDDQDEYC